MKHLIVMTMVVFGLAGCATKVWTVTMDSVPHNLGRKVSLFGPDEHPVFVIANATGKTAGISVRDRRNDKVVRSISNRRVGKAMQEIRMPDLPWGPYVAELHVNNDHVDSWSFEIAERVYARVPMPPGVDEPPPGDERLDRLIDGWMDLPEGDKQIIMSVIDAAERRAR